MRRHWQHTSFCMGQCVSSCGSKRTLDSVPATPDTESHPGLAPFAKITYPKQSCNFTESEEQNALALTFYQKPKSSAAKFAAAFHQRKIVTRRINPESESPVHINTTSTPSAVSLPLTGTNIKISSCTSIHHGDMKDSAVKSYFRETISSAKKTSSKSVSFSEISPTQTNARKKPFFVFGKSSKKVTKETHPSIESTASHSLAKIFLLKKKHNGPQTLPAIVRPVKERQVCRVTLSPKHGTTVVQIELQEGNTSFQGSDSLELNTNGGKAVIPNISPGKPSPSRNQAMGNASSSQGLVAEAVKTIKPIVNSTSKSKNPNIDVNENDTKNTFKLIKSVDSSVLAYKDLANRFHAPASNTGYTDVHRNIKTIKEENRLLRLKFFLQDSPDNCRNPSVNADANPDQSLKMNRHNVLGNRSGIPLPKSTVGKSMNNISSIPKLYSVSCNENESAAHKITNSKPKLNQKREPAQPTNLNSGKWVPATEFFENTDMKQQPDSPASLSTAKSLRRLSEPLKPTTPPSNTVLHKAVRGDARFPDPIVERRGTTIGFQQRKQVGQSSGSKLSKPGFLAEKDGVVPKNIPVKYGIKKPEESKPFYTIGLYQNRPKTVESLKPFSGFHGVSTGIVKQRTQQYQAKATDSIRTNANLVDIVEKQNDAHQQNKNTSPVKPGVMRSATYTIRKHALVEDQREQITNKPTAKAKSDVDPRYLTWTVRKQSDLRFYKPNSEIRNREHGMLQKGIESCPKEEQIERALLSPPGSYPLHPSGASTSSMGTNDDAIGDPVVISDSEYLIDDEISDQPELTLTFKDSSHKLSPSSSGESLLSDIMLDHLDLNQERLLGELTSDSAISDISSHKPISKSICDHTMVPEKTQSLNKSCTKSVDKGNASITASPSPVKATRNLKSPRRTSRPTMVSKSPAAQAMTRSTEINASRPSTRLQSPATASVTGKARSTPEKKQVASKIGCGKPNQSFNSSYVSPSNRNRTSKESPEVDTLTVENVDKLYKQYEHLDTCMEVELGRSPVPFAEELLVEFQDLRGELETLRLQLESQERREREKDELILRLTSEVERLKAIENGDMVEKFKDRKNRTLTSPKLDGSNEDRSLEKKFINSLSYENAAVQTESNVVFNRAVTYPEEDEKYGELVSFRIGRSSSLRKKL